MRYVGLTALGIAFWANVILLRLLLTHHCAPAELASEVDVAREGELQAPAPLARTWGGGRPCIIGRSRGDEIDDLGSADRPVGGPLSKSALVAGLNAVRPRVAACYQQFRVPGTAMVNVVIAKSGRVASATVTGKFAETPTGACVERAMKAGGFPPSDGFSTPYPFQLR